MAGVGVTPFTKEDNPDIFVHFTEAQLKRLHAYGTVKRLEAGDYLFEEGARNPPMHVILSGRAGIYHTIGPKEVQIAEVREQDFTGEIAMISGTAALAFGRVLETTQVLEVPIESLRRLLVEDSELSDVIVSTFLVRRAGLTSRGLSSLQVVGSSFSSDTYRIREFLIKNNQPFNWLDTESDGEVEVLLEALQIKADETPVVIFKGSQVLKNPKTWEVAQLLGVSDVGASSDLFDVAVIGSGPAGLAASVNAASDGLSVINVDTKGQGGQAGNSSKIENYLGFPMGISGQELAERAAIQAQKFGVRVAGNQSARDLTKNGEIYEIKLCTGDVLKTRSVIIATGADYRKLDVPNLPEFEGKSVFYGATHMEAQLCRDQSVALVGAGNSAGQGAVFLSQHAKHVTMIVRGEGLADKMSRYLIRRIEESPNITLLAQSEVNKIVGEAGHVQKIRVRDNRAGEDRWLDVSNLFLFIGAKPCTEWVDHCLALDERGFIKTGTDILPGELVRCGWALNRMPAMFETALPRVYAVGDVRSNSVKRVAAAVGEGSMSVGFLYRALNQE